MTALVILKTAASLLVILVGWIAAERRRAAEPDGPARLRAITSDASRLVLDVTLPALAFTQIVRTSTPEALRAAWYVPIAGAGLLTIAALTGLAFAALGAPSRRRTIVFVAGVPNWVYLPLPIAAGLFGEAGTRTILLMNVGSLAWLWTIGVFILQGRWDLRASARAVLGRPGLWATIAGVAAALFVPSLRRLLVEPAAPRDPISLVVLAGLQALELLGGLTVPVALLVTGAQLAELRGGARAGARMTRDVALVVLARLVVGPIVCALLLAALLPRAAGAEARATLALVAAMPVAVSCGMFTRDYGGDDGLAAGSILATTILALATVPGCLALFRALGLL